jgi:5'-methylthioadenosine phosphorylase
VQSEEFMAEHRIGIIGGSGLYHIEGFTRQRWLTVKTPFGNPSDSLLTGELSGRKIVFIDTPERQVQRQFRRIESLNKAP